jgi:hypothetical protein
MGSVYPQRPVIDGNFRPNGPNPVKQFFQWHTVTASTPYKNRSGRMNIESTWPLKRFQVSANQLVSHVLWQRHYFTPDCS